MVVVALLLTAFDLLVSKPVSYSHFADFDYAAYSSTPADASNAHDEPVAASTSTDAAYIVDNTSCNEDDFEVVMLHDSASSVERTYTAFELGSWVVEGHLGLGISYRLVEEAFVAEFDSALLMMKPLEDYFYSLKLVK